MENLALLSVQRNEGPFLLEFIAHHLALGIKEFLLVTNPSDDGTNELAEELAAIGVVRHVIVDTPKGMKPLEHGYTAARNHLGTDKYEWLLTLDADELLNIHTIDGTIGGLIGMIGQDVDVISFNMACFGNFPHESWDYRDSSDRFKYRLESKHSRSSPSKALIHFPENFEFLKPHGPVGFRLDRPVRVALHAGLKTVSLDAGDPGFYSFLRQPGSFRGVHSVAQVNHYIIRTLDSFKLRAARGRANAPLGRANTRHTAEYFHAYADGRYFDDSISRYSHKMNCFKSELLDNYRVKLCHVAAIERYRRKLSEL